MQGPFFFSSLCEFLYGLFSSHVCQEGLRIFLGMSADVGEGAVTRCWSTTRFFCDNSGDEGLWPHALSNAYW